MTCFDCNLKLTLETIEIRTGKRETWENVPSWSCAYVVLNILTFYIKEKMEGFQLDDQSRSAIFIVRSVFLVMADHVWSATVGLAQPADRG